jgi:hypothetical protein
VARSWEQSLGRKRRTFLVTGFTSASLRFERNTGRRVEADDRRVRDGVPLSSRYPAAFRIQPRTPESVCARPDAPDMQSNAAVQIAKERQFS